MTSRANGFFAFLAALFFALAQLSPPALTSLLSIESRGWFDVWSSSRGDLPSGPSAADEDPLFTEPVNVARATPRRSLFGEPKIAPPAPPPPPPDHTRALAAFRLVGILSDGPDGLAILRHGDTPETPYLVGEQLPDGFVLHAVQFASVILEKGGNEFTLTLEDEDAIASLGPADDGLNIQVDLASIAPGVKVETRTETRTNQQASVFTPKLDDHSKKRLRDYARLAATQPLQVASLVRAEPARTSAGDLGFRLFPAAERRLFSLAGLRPGDIVISVNGLRVAEAKIDQVPAIISQLSGATVFDIEIERDGRRRRLAIQL